MHVVEFVYFRPFKFQEGGLGGIKISLPDGLNGGSEFSRFPPCHGPFDTCIGLQLGNT